jgi:glucose-6-phosphate 1-dehydrogenase
MNLALNLTIFGGTGDLTFRKLIPALYMMSRTGVLGADSRVLIIGRRPYTSPRYRLEAEAWVRKFARLKFEEASWQRFAGQVVYYQMDFTQPAAYPELGRFLAQDQIQEHICYFAVAPRFFGVITTGLEQIPGLERSKIILEKPFGENLPQARELNAQLEKFVGKDGIYRIDHYLGKEMVRNMQTIRFANQVFKNVWNHEAVAAVEISALEDVGVETRGDYYDASGALKDMVQNHLFQVMTMLAMEEPEEFTAAGIHRAQLQVLKELQCPRAEDLVLGQYAGYREEPKVDPHSNTETYACLKLLVQNQRWQDTPFYIRTGKKTGVRETEVSVIFKRLRHDIEPNVLRILIQPTEGVDFRFNIKQPGESEAIVPAEMNFCQSCNVEFHRNTPEAYERLLGACMKGDQAWFSQWDQIEASWAFVEKLKQVAATAKIPVHEYPAGSRGPQAAEDLLAQDGLKWME